MMNLDNWEKTLFKMKNAFLLIAAIAIGACSGGGGGSDNQTAGIGGTGIVQGKVTGFGSVYVNGTRFVTSSATFIVDGDPQAIQDDLALGMVLSLKAETDENGFTGTAVTVSYDDEIQGPVAAPPVFVPGSNNSQKSFDIFGQTITIDSTTTLFEAIAFDTLDAGDVVEISGFRESPTQIRATYVRKTDDLMFNVSEVELRGVVSNYAAGPPETFEVDGVTVTTDAMTVINTPGGVLANGLYVEVEGIITASLAVTADIVEFEDDSLGSEVEDVSLQGVISNYVSDSDFEIDGQAIDASGATFSPAGAALGDGLEIEVEGDVVGGVLQADELEIREGEVEINAFVSSVAAVGNNEFSVSFATLPGSVTIRVDAQTLFEDEAGATPVENMTINDLAVGNFVEIEGQEVAGEVLAGTIKRLDTSEAGKLKLKGMVDGFSPLNWIEILGIQYNVDNTPPDLTQYEEGTLTGTQFFNLLDVDDVVEIEDDNSPVPADGFAEEVEFD